MNTPTLFCHYGNSDCLRYTLRVARIFNPGKQIVLPGDQSNVPTAKQECVEHRPDELYAVNNKKIIIDVLEIVLNVNSQIFFYSVENQKRHICTGPMIRLSKE